MERLCSMCDPGVDAEYDLYLMDAKIVVDRIKGSYRKRGISDVQIHLFNADFQFMKIMQKIKDRKYLSFSNSYQLQKYSADLLGDSLIAEKDKLLNKELIKYSHDVYAKLGYGSTPFVISVKDKNISDNDLPWELIDGFRRIFYTNFIPDSKVLVKVYSELNDSLWINAMTVYNSWKIANKTDAKSIIDRGFRLGLFYRYKIDFTDFHVRGEDGIWNTINQYLGKDAYHTLYNNDHFYNDIKFIFESKMYRPSFRASKKKSIEEFDTSLMDNEIGFYFYLINIFIAYVGMIRRFECVKGMSRKDFLFEWIEEFFSSPENQEDFIKLSSLKFYGHIKNYVTRVDLESRIKNFLELRYGISLITKVNTILQ